MVFEGNTVDRTAADSFFSFFFSLGLLLAMTPRYRVRAPGPRLAYRNILAGFWGNCKYLEILHRGSPEVFRSSSYTLYLPQLKTMAFNAEGEKVEANFCKETDEAKETESRGRAPEDVFSVKQGRRKTVVLSQSGLCNNPQLHRLTRTRGGQSNRSSSVCGWVRDFWGRSNTCTTNNIIECRNTSEPQIF